MAIGPVAPTRRTYQNLTFRAVIRAHARGGLAAPWPASPRNAHCLHFKRSQSSPALSTRRRWACIPEPVKTCHVRRDAKLVRNWCAAEYARKCCFFAPTNFAAADRQKPRTRARIAPVIRADQPPHQVRYPCWYPRKPRFLPGYQGSGCQSGYRGNRCFTLGA